MIGRLVGYCCTYMLFISLSEICNCCFFFFKAEAGIRVHCGTGVQTCAFFFFFFLNFFFFFFWKNPQVAPYSGAILAMVALSAGSEESRGGKEWRSRWSPNN